MSGNGDRCSRARAAELESVRNDSIRRSSRFLYLRIGGLIFRLFFGPSNGYLRVGTIWQAHLHRCIFERTRREAEKRWRQRVDNEEHRELFRAKFEEVRRSPHHVISELLQNAEDVGASEAEVQVRPDRILFRHNGRDFSEDEFDAFCKLGVSSKKHLFTIGFMGVGSKSVFAVGDSFEIHSDSLHVQFDVENVTVPVWINCSPDYRAAWTTYLISLRDADARGRIDASLRRWLSNPCSIALFTNLSRLDASGRVVTVRRSAPVGMMAPLTVVASDGTTQRVTRLSSESFSFPHACVAEIQRIRSTDRVPNAHVEVLIGSSVDGQVSIVLPTKMSLPIPFAINGPFLPDSTRERIQDPEDSPTNAFLLAEIGTLVAEHVATTAANDALSIDERLRAYELIPPDDDDRVGLLERHCLSAIFQGVRRRLSESRFLLLANGDLAAPGEACDVPPVFHQVWTPDEIKSTLPDERSVLAPRIARNAVDRMASVEWIVALDDMQVRALLSGNSTTPRPYDTHKLHVLWSYCEQLTSDYLQRSTAPRLNVFPVTGSAGLESAARVCRINEDVRNRAADLWHFIQRHVGILDAHVIDYEACEACLPEDKGRVGEFLKRAGVAGTTSHDSVLRMCWAAVRKAGGGRSDNVDTLRLALLLNAQLPDDFEVFCRDGVARSSSQALICPTGHTSASILPTSWLHTHAISDEYRSSCATTDQDWLAWLTSRTQIAVTAIPTRTEAPFKDPEGELKRRGAIGRPSRFYPGNHYGVDYDFDRDLLDHWLAETDSNRMTWADVVSPILRHTPRLLADRVDAKMAASGYRGNWQAARLSGFVAEWVLRFRELSCVEGSDEQVHVPKALFIRTAETEPLLNFVPFVASELDSAETRPGTCGPRMSIRST